MPTEPAPVVVETDGGVTTIRIARPEKKNALTMAMYDALSDGLEGAGRDASVRAVVLAGAPGIFTAGNDLEDFLLRPPTGPESPVFRFMHALSGCEKPVVAAVTGPAVGVGTTLLLHCDLVVVAAGARLSMPFVHLGLVPEFASSLLVPRALGHAKAAEKLLLGEPISADEALAWGLCNEVVASDLVLPRAHALAGRFGALPAEAVVATKRLLRRADRAAVADAIEAEAVVFAERLRSPEALAAFQSFLARGRRG